MNAVFVEVLRLGKVATLSRTVENALVALNIYFTNFQTHLRLGAYEGRGGGGGVKHSL